MHLSRQRDRDLPVAPEKAAGIDDRQPYDATLTVKAQDVALAGLIGRVKVRLKPSAGLEPATPSLPWKFERAAQVTSRH